MYLTKRQKEILDYINRYVDENGYAPTLKEIGTGFGLSSPATVYNHIELLVQKGYLKKTPHQGRGIELVDGDPVRTTEVPILGQISAARIIQATTAGETVNLPPDFIALGTCLRCTDRLASSFSNGIVGKKIADTLAGELDGMLGFWFFTRVMNCAASDGDMTAVVANDAGTRRRPSPKYSPKWRF